MGNVNIFSSAKLVTSGVKDEKERKREKTILN